VKLQRGNTPCVPSQPMNAFPMTCSGTRARSGNPAQRRSSATLECAIGLLLIVGRGLRLAVYLLFGELIGILSPVVLLSGRLFAGPHGAPTLEGQYVLKDVVLVAAAMVVTAGSFRGGRLVRAEVWPIPASPPREEPGTAPRQHA